MSSSSGTPLDVLDQIARIERNQAEIQKLFAEQEKLRSEGKKFDRDPWMLVAGAIIAGAFTRLPEILHALRLAP